jgi:hypothetical protein
MTDVAYTTVLRTAGGIVLARQHAHRLARVPSGEHALREVPPTPGVYSILAGPDGVEVRRRDGGSWLQDGMPSRLATSPVAGAGGPIPKPPPPGPYATVRVRGVATLLTSPDGAELWEACAAAVIGWDGRRFVLVPRDRPRVDPVAEAALREHLPFVERPLHVDEPLPLALLNAVRGICAIAVPGRPDFPEEPRRQVNALLETLTE